jgi:hypothetical protein
MRIQIVEPFYGILNKKGNTITYCSQRILYKTIVFLNLILIYHLPIHAQDGTKKDSISKIPADSIFVMKADNAYTSFRKPLEFTSFIQVKVHGLIRLQKVSEQKKKSVILFLDGIAMKGITSIGGDKKNDVLFFLLHRDNVSMKQWSLLRKIIVEQKKKRLSVSVGFDGEQAYPTSILMDAELSRAGDYFLAILSGSFFIIVFTFLAKRSNVLFEGKDSFSCKYSLAKTLLAAWILLILFYLVFILSATNTLPHLPNTILSLIVFSTITLIGTKIHQLLNPISDQTPNPIKRKSNGFLADMLTNDHGLNLFKIQLLFFNLLIMIHITIEVISVMILPDFEIQVIVLIGFSHLLYIGSLFFEKKP